MNLYDYLRSMSCSEGRSDSTFANFFSLEMSRPIEAKFHVEPPWDGEMKICSNGPAHMTIYGKNF